MKKNKVMLSRSGEEYICRYVLDTDDVVDTKVDMGTSGRFPQIIPHVLEEHDGQREFVYRIGDRIPLAEYVKKEFNKEQMLELLYHVLTGLESFGMNMISLSYVAKDMRYIFVNPETGEAAFIVAAVDKEMTDLNEVKELLQAIIINASYFEMDRDNYVAKLITFTNRKGTFSVTDMKKYVNDMLNEMGIDIEARKKKTEASVSGKVSRVGVMQNQAKMAPQMMQRMPMNGAPMQGRPMSNGVPMQPQTMSMKGAPMQNRPMPNQPTPNGVPMQPQTMPMNGAPMQNRPMPNQPIPSRPIPNGVPVQPMPMPMNGVPMPNRPMPSRPMPNGVPVQPMPMPNGMPMQKMPQPMPMPNGMPQPEAKPQETPVPQPEAETKPQEAPAPQPEAETKPQEALAPQSEAEVKPQKAPVPQPEIKPQTAPTPYLLRVATNEKIYINKSEFSIGRSTTKADYTVTDNTDVSRIHCVIDRKNGVSYIKDNASTNGTFVNGQNIAGKADRCQTACQCSRRRCR